MYVAKDFRDKARESLQGKWGLAVGTGFVATLAGTYTALDYNNSDIDTESIDELLSNSSLSDVVLGLIGLALIVLAVCVLVGAVISLIFTGPITLGYVKFNLNLVDGNNPKFSDLFSQFHRFGQGFLLQLLRIVFIFLWMCLFIIPGLIAQYRYAMAPYILYENPDMSASDAIKASKQLMEGNKWRLFCLDFSFIGWDLLSVFTLGIGYLWVKPYREAAFAAFYRGIKHNMDFEFDETSDKDDYFGSNMQNFNM